MKNLSWKPPTPQGENFLIFFNLPYKVVLMLVGVVDASVNVA